MQNVREYFATERNIYAERRGILGEGVYRKENTRRNMGTFGSKKGKYTQNVRGILRKIKENIR